MYRIRQEIKHTEGGGCLLLFRTFLGIKAVIPSMELRRVKDTLHLHMHRTTDQWRAKLDFGDWVPGYTDVIKNSGSNFYFSYIWISLILEDKQDQSTSGKFQCLCLWLSSWYCNESVLFRWRKQTNNIDLVVWNSDFELLV